MYHALSKNEQQDSPKKRPGPQGFFSDGELQEHICDVIKESSFYGKGYRKGWVREFGDIEDLYQALQDFWSAIIASG